MLCANGQSLMYASSDKEFEEEDGGLNMGTQEQVPTSSN